MYKKILVALENGPADRALVPHVTQLARKLESKLLLVHVADGWVARNFDDLKLAESDEMKQDRAYLDGLAATMRGAGLQVETMLGLGEPPTAIVKIAEQEQCDLIALAAHGHKALGDLIFGSTISKVHHSTNIPMLVVHAER